MSRSYSPAQGEPWSVMYTNVINTLMRSRAMYPLRLCIDEVYNECLPGIDTGNPLGHNLVACLNFQDYVNFDIGDYLFHMVAPKGKKYATPVEGSMLLPKEHSHWEMVMKWVTEAGEFEDFLTNARIYLNRTLKVMKHPRWVQKHWPAIVPYVGELPLAMTMGMREPMERQIAFDRPLMDRIETSLTAAALVDRAYVPIAWVGPFARRKP